MSIIGKQPLCKTAASKFNQFVGFNGAWLYLNYDTAISILRYHNIPEPYSNCLAQAEVDGKGDIVWWVEPWTEQPILFSELNPELQSQYRGIYDETCEIWSQAASKSKQAVYANALKEILATLTLDNAYCFDGRVVFVAWGMQLDTMKAPTIGTIVVPCNQPFKSTKVRVEFACTGGVLKERAKRIAFVENGTVLDASHIPTVVPDEEGSNIEWCPVNPIGYCVTDSTRFEARCTPSVIESKEPEEHEDPIIAPIVTKPDSEPEKCRCTFDPGEQGTIKGDETQFVNDGDSLSEDSIPLVEPRNGYEFLGWDNDVTSPIRRDTQFTAQYRKIPWWRRFLLWLRGLGLMLWGWLCGLWHWLRKSWWRLLLFLLLLALLLFLLRCCHGCTGTGVPLGPEDDPTVVGDPNMGQGGIYNPGHPYRPNPTDGNYDDVLPPQEGVLPPVGDDIIENPGGATVVANQIDILMENEDRHIGDLAQKFKQLYPGEAYQVTYYDNVTKRMNVTVPVSERLSIKGRLPQQVAPEFSIFVFDEALFEGTYIPTDPDFSTRNSWYMEKINILKAWEITKGSPDISVAIVDNGFNIKHPEFKGRVCGAYNVWRHSDKVDAHKVDHGTHVAGIALASMDNGAGSCGIAPQCAFIPVQVADEKDRMTTTSILDGILYAIYQGADVVNVSLGQCLNGLDEYSEAVQQELINNHFKEEERLWNKVMQIAEKHHCVIVFAAGNDNVLAGIDPQQRSQGCVVVSAVNKKNQPILKADFSNYGDYSTVSAPGVDIYSSCGDGYALMSGTSMAAPIVTGIVALMKSVKRDLTIQEVRCILQTTGKSSPDKVGPLVQAFEAVDMVAKGESCEMEETVADSVVIHHGDVEISLTWANRNDLDLFCKDPAGELIMFSHPRSASNGCLDVDMNCRQPLVDNPIEHIYWPVGGAPKGTYQVFVLYYKCHDAQERTTPFRVTIKANGAERTLDGVAETPNQQQLISVCSFDVE